jgi:hypothetical protein
VVAPVGLDVVGALAADEPVVAYNLDAARTAYTARAPRAARRRRRAR